MEHQKLFILAIPHSIIRRPRKYLGPSRRSSSRPEWSVFFRRKPQFHARPVCEQPKYVLKSFQAWLSDGDGCLHEPSILNKIYNTYLNHVWTRHSSWYGSSFYYKSVLGFTNPILEDHTNANTYTVGDLSVAISYPNRSRLVSMHSFIVEARDLGQQQQRLICWNDLSVLRTGWCPLLGNESC